MTYRVQEVTPKGRVAFQALSADTGQPIRITTHTGEALIGLETGRPIVYRPGADNAGRVGFLVPNVALAGNGTGLPDLVAEVYLCGVFVRSEVDRDYGVEDVAAAFTAAPRGGAAQWLTLTFTCRAAHRLRIGYRVTITEALTA